MCLCASTAVFCGCYFISHATAIVTIVRPADSDFRLVDRFVTQIERIQTLDELEKLTSEVVDAT